MDLDIPLHLTGEMTAGELLVGMGTLALAIFTAWLAKRTSREVELNEHGLRLTRESIEAIDRPFVIASANNHYNALAFLDPGGEHPGMRFAYCLWNLGKGPAIVEQVSLRDSAGTEYLTEIDGLERAIAVAPGIRDELTPFAGGVPGVGAELRLSIRYRSASGRRYRTESALLVNDRLWCTCRDFRRKEIGPAGTV